jgi:hypothetical protein
MAVVDSEAVLAEGAAETPAAVGDLAALAVGVLAAAELVGIGEAGTEGTGIREQGLGNGPGVLQMEICW